MRKPYVPIYISSVVFSFIGLFLIMMDLVIAAQLDPNAPSIIALLRWNRPVEFGVVLLAVGVYHFILGLLVDKLSQETPKKVNFLDQDIM